MLNTKSDNTIAINHTAGLARATYMTNVTVFPRRTGRRPPLWNAPYYLRTHAASSDTSSATSAVLVPRLPWEVIDLICRHADLQTLLVLCWTSFGLLELSGRLVYESVTLHKLEPLRLLLYQVGVPNCSPLRSALGLQHTRCLQINAIPGENEVARSGIFATRSPRLSAMGKPMEVDTLRVLLAPAEEEDAPMEFYLHELFPYLNPRQVLFMGGVLEGYSERASVVTGPPTLVFPAACIQGWTRLQFVHFTGTLVRVYPSEQVQMPRTGGAIVSSRTLFPASVTPPHSLYFCTHFGPASPKECNQGAGRLGWWEDFLLELVRSAAYTGVEGLKDNRHRHIRLIVDNEDDVTILQGLLQLMKSASVLDETSASLFHITK